MKTSTVLLLGAGGYALYYFSQLGVATSTVRVVFNGVNVKGITNYEVLMTVQNLSNISINVNSMAGDIILNGNRLATLAFFNGQIVVPANSQIDIPVNVSPDLLSIPSVIRDIIHNGVGTLNFTVIGDANINGLVLPFNLDKAVSF